jgi:hypothetical protein
MVPKRHLAKPCIKLNQHLYATIGDVPKHETKARKFQNN